MNIIPPLLSYLNQNVKTFTFKYRIIPIYENIALNIQPTLSPYESIAASNTRNILPSVAHLVLFQTASLNMTWAQLTVDQRMIFLNVLLQAHLWNRFIALGTEDDVLATVDLMHDEVSLSHISLTAVQRIERNITRQIDFPPNIHVQLAVHI